MQIHGAGTRISLRNLLRSTQENEGQTSAACRLYAEEEQRRQTAAAAAPPCKPTLPRFGYDALLHKEECDDWAPVFLPPTRGNGSVPHAPSAAHVAVGPSKPSESAAPDDFCFSWEENAGPNQVDLPDEKEYPDLYTDGNEYCAEFLAPFLRGFQPWTPQAIELLLNLRTTFTSQNCTLSLHMYKGEKGRRALKQFDEDWGISTEQIATLAKELQKYSGVLEEMPEPNDPPVDEHATTCQPGTAGKIEVIKRRLESGISLWHPDDPCSISGETIAELQKMNIFAARDLR